MNRRRATSTKPTTTQHYPSNDDSFILVLSTQMGFIITRTGIRISAITELSEIRDRTVTNTHTHINTPIILLTLSPVFVSSVFASGVLVCLLGCLPLRPFLPPFVRLRARAYHRLYVFGNYRRKYGFTVDITHTQFRCFASRRYS